MRLGKAMVLVALGFLLGLGYPPAEAFQQAPQKSLKGGKGAVPKRAGEASVSAPGKVRPIRKGMEFVKKIEGGFLYTETGKYSLSGVKVTDLSKTRKDDAGGAVSTRKKTAEMTFLNHRLHEVVIRQR